MIALGLWLALLAPVLRHWRTPTVGASFVLTVATESLAVLAAALAAPSTPTGCCRSRSRRSRSDSASTCSCRPLRSDASSPSAAATTGSPAARSRSRPWPPGRIAAGAEHSRCSGAAAGFKGSRSSLGADAALAAVLLLAEALRPRRATTCGAGRPSSRSGCTPRAASWLAAARASAITTSPAYGYGSRWRCGRSCSRRCSAARSLSCTASSDRPRRRVATGSTPQAAAPCDPPTLDRHEVHAPGSSTKTREPLGTLTSRRLRASCSERGCSVTSRHLVLAHRATRCKPSPAELITAAHASCFLRALALASDRTSSRPAI